MPSDRVSNALRAIRDNIVRVRRFVGGLDLDSFAVDDKTFYAAMRALEIISEASRRLPDEMRGRHPHLPWRGILDAGNFYRHQYDNVLESYIWATIHNDLPPLLAAVEQELRTLEQLP